MWVVSTAPPSLTNEKKKLPMESFWNGPRSNVSFNSVSNQIKLNQITFIVTSPQHKCLGEWNSYERAPDSAEKQQTIYIWTDSAKKQQTIYIWTDSAKNCTGAFTVLQTVQKNNNNLHMDRQCKKATAIYIWTVHIYRLYRRQCAKYTYIYSVHSVL